MVGGNADCLLDDVTNPKEQKREFVSPGREPFTMAVGWNLWKNPKFDEWFERLPFLLLLLMNSCCQLPLSQVSQGRCVNLNRVVSTLHRESPLIMGVALAFD